MNSILRSFQKSIYKESLLSLLKNPKIPVVMGLCPRGGKTFIAGKIIKFFIWFMKRCNKPFKVLILAYARIDIREQFSDELKNKLGLRVGVVEHSKDFDRIYKAYDIIVTLPQTLETIPNLSQYSIQLFIDDEAHYWFLSFKKGKRKAYGAEGTVSRIYREIKPDRTLLLTGSKSPFVYENQLAENKNKMPPYNIVSKSFNEVRAASDSTVTDFIFEMVEANYSVPIETSKETLDVDKEIDDCYLPSQKEHTATLEKMLVLMYKHLKSPTRDVGYSLKPIEPTSLLALFGKFPRTIYSAASIPEAYLTSKFFKAKGLNVAISYSNPKSQLFNSLSKDLQREIKELVDEDGTELSRFKKDPTVDILILVDRGILGSSFPDVQVAIDNSGRTDLDANLQFMLRVASKHKDLKKLAIKMYPSSESGIFQPRMCATLALTNEWFYDKYNGVNFEDLPVTPYIKKSTKPSLPKGGGSHGSNGGSKDFTWFIGIPNVATMFDRIYKKQYLPYEVVAWTSIRNYNKKLLGKKLNLISKITKTLSQKKAIK